MSKMHPRMVPRIGHHPPLIDGVKYLQGWRRRRAGEAVETDDISEAAGWDDAISAQAQGRDIDWPDRNNLGEVLA